MPHFKRATLNWRVKGFFFNEQEKNKTIRRRRSLKCTKQCALCVKALSLLTMKAGKHPLVKPSVRVKRHAFQFTVSRARGSTYLYSWLNKSTVFVGVCATGPEFRESLPMEIGQFSAGGVWRLFSKRRWRFLLVLAQPVNGACLLPSITAGHANRQPAP